MPGPPASLQVPAPQPLEQVPVGQVDIQHTYDIGLLTADPGDTIYSQIVGQELPARRLHVWNAQTDQQVFKALVSGEHGTAMLNFHGKNHSILPSLASKPMAPVTQV
mgnify:CR=1 FL=1